MKLSPRLFTIVEMIDDNSLVYDVGCDHAYLDIYLTLYKHNVNCVAIDKKEHIVKMALLNITEYKLQDRIEVVQSDGLNNVDVKNESTIVLSGLGTTTIVNILKNNLSKLSKKLIIQSNNDHCILRKKIVKLGYFIEKEKLVSDGKKDYIIIKFSKGFKKHKKLDYLLGPELKNNKKHIKKEITRYKEILKKLPHKYIVKRIKLNLILYQLKKRL